MKTVNPYFLHTLIDPLAGGADDDDEVARYESLDPNDEASVRKVIRDLLVPYYRERSTAEQERAKTALGYYLLETGKVDFGRVFHSILPPFYPPADPRRFFLWLWEELFPGEAIDVGDTRTFKEVRNINEPNRLAAEVRAKQKRH